MKLPPGSARVVASSVALATLTTALAHRADGAARIELTAALCAVVAFATRQALVLLSARHHGVPLNDSAARYRLLRRTWPAAAAGAALGALVGRACAAAALSLTLSIALACGLGIGLACALTRVEPVRAASPRRTALLTYVLMDTALPAGVVAACVAWVVTTARFGALTVVPAGLFARHLASTTFLYAVFLGFGGFLKAFTEKRAGLLVTADAATRWPGPISVGAVVAVLFLFGGAWVLPSLALSDVLIIKVVVATFLGGGLSALGALQGLRAASVAGAAGTPPT